MTAQLIHAIDTPAPYTVWGSDLAPIDDAANIGTARAIQARNPDARIFDNSRGAFVTPTVL